MKTKQTSIIIILITCVFLSGAVIWRSSKWDPFIIKVKNRIHRTLFHKESIPSDKEFKKFISDKKNNLLYAEFTTYLKQHKLSHIVPPNQLIRQGTDWNYLKLSPYVIPPKKYWKNILPVLRFLRDEVTPVIKDLEVVSGYRSKEYNQRAGGAKNSRHLIFAAVDLIPENKISRNDLHAILLTIWKKRGKKHNAGLGLYSKKRFHLDTYRYRKWQN